MSAPAPRENPLDRLHGEIDREVEHMRRHQMPDTSNLRRCRVCRDPEVQSRVNKLIAYGIKDPDIVNELTDLNAKRAKNRQITYWVVRRHREAHFNIQQPAQAAYRRMMERRAAQQGEDLIAGSRSYLTAMGYLDIIAHKGLQKLMDPDTEVGFTTGLEAQLKLEEMMTTGETERKLAEYRRQVGWLQQVVMEEVDEVTRARISNRLAELAGKASSDDAIEAEVVDDDDDDDDGYDPVMEADPEDTMGED